MPDRRRRGAHEDRGASGARGEARPLAARPPDRIFTALRAARGQMAEARQLAQRRGAPAAMVGTVRGLERAAEPAALACRSMVRADALSQCTAGAVGRVLCRYR